MARQPALEVRKNKLEKLKAQVIELEPQPFIEEQTSEPQLEDSVKSEDTNQEQESPQPETSEPFPNTPCSAFSRAHFLKQCA